MLVYPELAGHLVIISPFELFCTVITPPSSTGRPQEEEDRPQEGKGNFTSLIQMGLRDGRVEGGLFIINQFLMCPSNKSILPCIYLQKAAPKKKKAAPKKKTATKKVRCINCIYNVHYRGRSIISFIHRSLLDDRSLRATKTKRIRTRRQKKKNKNTRIEIDTAGKSIQRREISGEVSDKVLFLWIGIWVDFRKSRCIFFGFLLI